MTNSVTKSSSTYYNFLGWPDPETKTMKQHSETKISLKKLLFDLYLNQDTSQCTIGIILTHEILSIESIIKFQKSYYKLDDIHYENMCDLVNTLITDYNVPHLVRYDKGHKDNCLNYPSRLLTSECYNKPLSQDDFQSYIKMIETDYDQNINNIYSEIAGDYITNYSKGAYYITSTTSNYSNKYLDESNSYSNCGKKVDILNTVKYIPMLIISASEGSAVSYYGRVRYIISYNNTNKVRFVDNLGREVEFVNLTTYYYDDLIIK